MTPRPAVSALRAMEFQNAPRNCASRRLRTFWRVNLPASFRKAPTTIETEGSKRKRQMNTKNGAIPSHVSERARSGRLRPELVGATLKLSRPRHLLAPLLCQELGGFLRLLLGR